MFGNNTLIQGTILHQFDTQGTARSWQENKKIGRPVKDIDVTRDVQDIDVLKTHRRDVAVFFPFTSFCLNTQMYKFHF